MRQRGRALTTVLAVPDHDEFLWLFVRVTFVTGNGYYIPKATEQGLNVKVSLQTSRNHRGENDTAARYATAWLDHGANPTAKGYEYAILVGTQLSELQVLNTFNVKYISIVKYRPHKCLSSLKNHNVIFWSVYWKRSTVGLLFCFCRHLLHKQTVYEVIHKDNNAHAVKFNNFPRQNENQWGYAFFHKSARTPGPVRRVTKVTIS